MMKFKKTLRYVLLVMMIILALIGIPVVPPQKFEMEKHDETKTELVEESKKD